MDQGKTDVGGYINTQSTTVIKFLLSAMACQYYLRFGNQRPKAKDGISGRYS